MPEQILKFMNIITSNPLVNLPGPAFLVCYGVVIALLLSWTWWRVREMDPTRNLEPPKLPETFDPHELAFLRGGHSELVRIVLLDLVLRGLVERQEKKSFLSVRHEFRQVPGADVGASLESDEWLLFNALKAPVTSAQIVTTISSRLYDLGFGQHVRARLEEQQLIPPPGAPLLGLRITLHLFITGLAFYKIAIALERGRHNLAFLILFCLAANIALYVFGKGKRLTQKGRDLFEKSKLALTSLRNIPRLQASRDPHVSEGILLATSVFGLSLLENTSYAYFPEDFKRSASSSGGCGSSCGSSSSSGCGGGGGCGGGCGGGGCGGCGGG